MQFKKQRVILVLTPASIDAAVLSGKSISRADRIELDPKAWQHAWEEGLVSMDQPLASLMRRLRAADKPEVLVIAETPTDLISVNTLAGDAAAAEEAALYAAEEKLEQSDRPAPPAVRALGTEKTSEGVRTHVLTAIESDETLQKVFAWVRRAGGELAGVVPIRAAMLCDVAQQLAAIKEDDAVVCSIGETCSALGGKAGGNIAFIRAIDLGVHAMADAYHRILGRQMVIPPTDEKTDSPESAQSCPNAAERFGRAMGLVYSEGIPMKSVPGNENTENLCRQALPLLAPVLQRLSIEIKQTVRYGMPVGTKAVESIRLVGAGACIPGLEVMLRSSLEMQCIPAQDVESNDPIKPFGPGSTADRLFSHWDGHISLLPTLAVEQGRSKKRSAALRTGALLAVALLAGEFGYIKMQQGKWDSSIIQQEKELVSTRAVVELQSKTEALVDDVGKAVIITNDTIGERADWYALLAEFSRLAVDPVELTELRMFYEGRSPMAALGGHAYDHAEGATGQGRSNTLGGFIEQLRASPLIEDVQLGSTSVEERSGRSAKRFSMQVWVTPFPIQYTHEGIPQGSKVVAADPGGGRP